MSMPRSPENETRLAEAYRLNREEGQTLDDAAGAVGMSRGALQHYIKQQSRAGKHLNDPPAMPGFVVSKFSTTENEDGEVIRRSIQQRPEPGEPYETPEGHTVKGRSTLVDADGNVIQQWVKTVQDAEAQQAALQAFIDGLKDEIPRAEPVRPPDHTEPDLATQYTTTDNHLGMLAWHEETGEDYDLVEAERLLNRFFDVGVAMAPPSETAILADLGDFLHFQNYKPLTPEHGNLLDADSRFPKVVRAAVRVKRAAVRRALEKHKRVHLILCKANHDEAASVWLREMFAVLYENEPRVTVDTSSSAYNCFEHGDTACFYHHGHKKKINDLDRVFVRDFHDVYGRTRYHYGHVGHLHKDEQGRGDLLIKMERHETLATRDAHTADGGWRSGRSAKVINYNKRFGEVGRTTLTPEMISG